MASSDAPPSPASAGIPALPAHIVIERVQAWVDRSTRQRPDFAGAYLWGGITAMPPDAMFALYRDVDVVIVSTAGSRDDNDEVYHHGLMLEVIVRSIDDHRDVEATLANPSAAPNIAATTILSDPFGILAPFQQAVAAQFAQRRWIRARCEAEKASARDALAAMRKAITPTDGVNDLWLLLNALSGLLAVAQRGRPTTRRTLALLSRILEERGRSDLRERLLALWGSAHMSRADVEAMLERCANAYDRAVIVYRTPTPLGFTLQAHLRPYLVEASREMIDEGLHREATFWMMAVAGESYLALQNDAPEAERPHYAAQAQTLHRALGYSTLEAWAERVASAEELAEEVFGIADDLVELHPE